MFSWKFLVEINKQLPIKVMNPTIIAVAARAAMVQYNTPKIRS